MNNETRGLVNQTVRFTDSKMTNILKYFTATNSWQGIRISGIGLLIFAPGLLIRVFFNIENILFINISTALALVGFAIFTIGMAIHFKYFINAMKNPDEGYKVKQPWEND